MKKSIVWEKEWVMLENDEMKSFISYNFPEINDEMDGLSYHDAIVERIRSKKYKLFIDIGAYIGYLSVIASNYCKQVWAYEASPLIYGLLLNNVKFIPNITPHYNFVSYKEAIPRINRVSNQERPFDMVNHTCTDPYNIPVITVDEIFSNIPPDIWVFVKMDIEGTEINALQGALNALTRKNTHWQIEVHNPSYYSKLGYFFPTKKRHFCNLFTEMGENITWGYWVTVREMYESLHWSEFAKKYGFNDLKEGDIINLEEKVSLSYQDAKRWGKLRSEEI